MRSVHEANLAAVEYAGAAHLLVGLLAVDGAAGTLLRSVGVDPAATVAAVRADPSIRISSEPYAPMVAILEPTGGGSVVMPVLSRMWQGYARQALEEVEKELLSR